MAERPLVLTAGEPAGIGPDLCVELAATDWVDRIVVAADPEMLRERANMLGRSVEILVVTEGQAFEARGALRVVPFDLPNKAVAGRLDPANAAAVLGALEFAAGATLRGEFSGLVTGPMQKSVINDAGIPFTGHTEFLADKTGANLPVMLLVAGNLRVALATTHLPLREVSDNITAERLRAVLEILHQDLKNRFAIDDPKIIVCGLNPHAGEGGHLGHEDDEVIAPVVEEFRDRGLSVRGPLPADTAFTPNAGEADAVLAMYHDQGLPVLKYAGFGNAVNVTLGLPIVRTSVDHGTALDIAGSGNADAGSLIAAIELAAQLAQTSR